ncbi:UDP-glucose 4-epimerase family protein [Amphritea sp.]|uniref:UDP-glucose 4-epimerase family protein n=1 Tax=Amphritea sp. TaxID=1872502 RepID=UPI003A8ECB8F
MKLLVTGATGFLGSNLVFRLSALGCDVVISSRGSTASVSFGGSVVNVGNMDANTDWQAAVQNVDAVIHTAAIAHVINENNANSIEHYSDVNAKGTLNLARQAASAGVKRFIFISTVKVLGESTAVDKPFKANDQFNPIGPYARSKWLAELGLMQLGADTNMEVVIIRPPLVYGPGVKANFLRMIQLVEKGIPLPLGAINNKRSFVALDNLVDLIITCIDHPAAANEVFLAGDGEDLSTSELLRGIAVAMGKPSRLFPVPESWLRFAARLLGKKDIADRLLDSLQVDISKTRDMLGWSPPISVEEGLRRCFDTGRDK